nr:uncharacterized protein I203_02726 [Kwoniella mangroviensis CBS 8507]OCF68067.1 hypothetical protein I203_02726 [Kwoniella mangroviensis CBS 8507]
MNRNVIPHWANGGHDLGELNESKPLDLLSASDVVLSGHSCLMTPTIQDRTEEDHGTCHTLSTPDGTHLTYDTYSHLLSVLLAQDDIPTLINLQLCSKSHYTVITPYLYRHLTLDEKCIDELLGQASRWNEGEGYQLFRSVRFGSTLIPHDDIKDILDLSAGTDTFDIDEFYGLPTSLQPLVTLLGHYRNFTGQYLFPSLQSIACVGTPDSPLELGEIWTLLSKLSAPTIVCFKHTEPFLYSNTTFASLDSFTGPVENISVHSAMPNWIPRSYSHPNCRINISYAESSCEERCDRKKYHPGKSCKERNKEEIAKWLVAGPKSNEERWKGNWSVHTGYSHTLQDLHDIKRICIEQIEGLEAGGETFRGKGWTGTSILNARLFVQGIRWVQEAEACRCCNEFI